MNWLSVLGIAVILVAIVSVFGLTPKGGRPVVRSVNIAAGVDRHAVGPLSTAVLFLLAAVLTAWPPTCPPPHWFKA